MRNPIRLACLLRTLALVAMSFPILPAEEVEQFTLADGREIIGSYDEAKGRLSALTPSGRIVVDVAKDQIVKRKPSAMPEFAAPAPAPVAAAPVAEAPEKPAVAAVPMPARPKPAPVAKPVGENVAKTGEAPPVGDLRKKQVMDLVRQMTQLQQAAAAGDAAAAQQLQQFNKQLQGMIQQAQQGANGKP